MDHSIHSLAELRVFCDGLDFARHHFAGLATMLVGVSVRAPAAADEKLEPEWALGLASEFAAAKEVALAQDPAQSVVGVEHDQRAHPRTQHRFDRFGDACAFRHADHAIGHYVPHLHSFFVLRWGWFLGTRSGGGGG